MLDISTLGWIVTIAVIVGLSWPRPNRMRSSFKEAIAWSVFYIAVLLIAFGFASSCISRRRFRTQYFAGYIVEKSLSVDNLFVFVIIMTTFAVPSSISTRC